MRRVFHRDYRVDSEINDFRQFGTILQRIYENEVGLNTLWNVH